MCDRVEERKETDSEKEAVMEAELRAARERAVVPQETRMGQFSGLVDRMQCSITSTASGSMLTHSIQHTASYDQHE